MTQSTWEPTYPDESFFLRLQSAPDRVLMLDYDGTLAPFRVDPLAAVPYRGIREALGEILRAGHTRLVVISGRTLDQLIELLRLDPTPEMWCSDGWEHLTAEGKYSVAPVAEEALNGLDLANHLAQTAPQSPRIEVKPISLALHWRGLPRSSATELRRWGQEHWGPLADSYGLDLQEFDGGLEMRVPGWDKGSAVHYILAGSPADTMSAYLGDDLTDEDAFNALPEGALGVLVRRTWRPTAATAWVRPPGELLQFLWQWNEACLEEA